MKTVYRRSLNSFFPADEAAIELVPELPVGNYRVCSHPAMGFYFERIDNFTMPPKTYGDTEVHAQRIINTFESRQGTTGVLLTGEKGSGKSLLAKKLSIDCAAKGIVTLVINTPFTGEDFNALLQNLHQPAVVLLDEFEKTYEPRQQQALLTLMDGTFTSKKLFILTCNDKYRVDQHMRNRPGRIFYMIEYEGLDEGFIRAYLADTQVNPAHYNSVVRIASTFSAFNFDMLKAICEEMVRYGETAASAIKLMNMKPTYDEGGEYTIAVRDMMRGRPVEMRYPHSINGNPLRRDEIEVNFLITLEQRSAKRKGGDDDNEGQKREHVELKLTSDNVTGMDQLTGAFVFEKDGYEVRFTRVVRNVSAYAALYRSAVTQL